MSAARAAIAALLMAGALAARAETVYVNDQLQVGVHQGKTVDTTIVELVPSGTALEVVARDGALVQVETPGGKRGWVDGRFLADSAPGRARVESLEAELAGAQAALADAQARLVALEQRQGSDAPGPNGNATPNAIPSDALREMQALAEENQRLKQQVAELEAMQRMARERASTAAAAPAATAPAPETAQNAPAPVPELLGRWETWQMLLLASVLLLAFGAGGWLVDWGIRRRHGGFRV